ncbi:MAG: TetR family transcriptional regulator [Sphingomonas sp.]|nr:TetR family transcriptional regulator [Sphingomonas sp.]
MAAPKGGSRQRLLDAAEKLFAQKGFDGTSIRDIAARSGDTIGTLSYHFGSKDALLGEVVRRRFHALGEMRRDKYRAIRAERTPDLHDVIRCIVEPFVDRALRGDEEWHSYIGLLGRMMYAHDKDHAAQIADLTDPISAELLGWLQDAAPSAHRVDIAHGYRFMIAAMIDACSDHSARRVGRVTGETESLLDSDQVCDRLVKFLIAGFSAVIAPDWPANGHRQGQKA